MQILTDEIKTSLHVLGVCTQGLIQGGGGVDWVASHPPWVCCVHNIFCLSTL